ncbi:MAG: hypothetical protein AB1815_07725 [Bacillota bacterium]
MRTLRKKISLILIFVLLANLLLPVMGLAAETNNSVIPDELITKSSEQILLSPDTTSWGDQAGTTQSNGISSNQENNNEEGIANQILEGIDKSNSQTGEVQTQIAPVVYVIATATVTIGSRLVPVIQRVTASSAGQLAMRAFSSGNFRHNLIVKTGGNPGGAYHAHHVFPQAVKYSNIFNRAGINVHDPKYGTWVTSKYHSNFSYQYDQRWVQYLDEYRKMGKYPTKSQLISYTKVLAKEFNFKTHF